MTNVGINPIGRTTRPLLYCSQLFKGVFDVVRRKLSPARKEQKPIERRRALALRLELYRVRGDSWIISFFSHPFFLMMNRNMQIKNFTSSFFSFMQTPSGHYCWRSQYSYRHPTSSENDLSRLAPKGSRVCGEDTKSSPTYTLAKGSRQRAKITLINS